MRSSQDKELVISDFEQGRIDQVAQAVHECLGGEPGWKEELMRLGSSSGEKEIALAASHIRSIIPFTGDIRVFEDWIIVTGVRQGLAASKQHT